MGFIIICSKERLFGLLTCFILFQGRRKKSHQKQPRGGRRVHKPVCKWPIRTLDLLGPNIQF